MTSMNRPYCLVLMPFGQKRDDIGTLIDFDSIYKDVVAPSIEESGLRPLRAYEELTQAVVQKQIFEHLIFHDYAIADLTTASPRIFYELGIRHALLPSTTIIIHAEWGACLPFDLLLMHSLPYRINRRGSIEDSSGVRKAIIGRLKESIQAQNRPTDSPLFQLIAGYPDNPCPTRTSRESIDDSIQMEQKISVARKQGVDSIRALEKVEI